MAKKMNKSLDDSIWIHDIVIQQLQADPSDPADLGDIVQLDIDAESMANGKFHKTFSMSQETARKFAQDIRGNL